MPTPANLPILRHLQVTPLQLVFVLESPWRGPALKSLLLRSALGYHLRRRECLTGAAACAGCPRMRECWYAFAFESPAELFLHNGLKRLDERVAHPFYCVSGPRFERELPRGALLPCLLTLFGAPHPLLGKLLASLEEAGRSGRWGGTFRLREVVSPLRPEVRYAPPLVSLRAQSELPRWQVPPPRASQSARLEFLSPLRIRIHGEVLRQPAFAEIVRSLLRRIHLLAALYGGARLDDDWKAHLVEQAERAVTVKQSWHYVREERTSGRQHRQVPIDGVLGAIAVAGDLSGLLPYLDVGQWLGAGASTGHGAYVLDAVDPTVENV